MGGIMVIGAENGIVEQSSNSSQGCLHSLCLRALRKDINLFVPLYMVK